MANKYLELAVTSTAGLFLGLFFFGGLWWTLGKGLSSKQPALWFLGSLLLRTSLVLAGFYFIAESRWERFLGCLLGFTIARKIITTFTRPQPEKPHAP